MGQVSPGSKASTQGETTLSVGHDYGDEPPRLSIAFNAVPSKLPDDKKQLEGVPTKAHIIEILKAIREKLGTDFKELWATQQSAIDKWACPPEEEAWAQAFTEVFYGITYGGPGLAYFWEGGWEHYLYSRVQPTYHRVQPRFRLVGDKSTGRRFQKMRSGWLGSKTVQRWDDPEQWYPQPGDPTDLQYRRNNRPTLDPKPSSNTDPAVPLIGACQYLTTYGLLARGLRIEWELAYRDGPAFSGGLMASQQTKQANLWKGSVTTDGLDEEQPADDGFYTEGDTINGVTVSHPDELKAALSPAKRSLAGFGGTQAINAGTSFVFNPNGFITSAYVAGYAEDDWGTLADRQRTRKEYREKHGVGAQKLPPPKKGQRPPAPGDVHEAGQGGWNLGNKRWREYLMGRDPMIDDREVKRLGFTEQDPGSHIYHVLRVPGAASTIDDRFQPFDTSNTVSINAMAHSNRAWGTTNFRPQHALMDGNARTGAWDGTQSPLTGVGIAPTTSGQGLTAMASHLKKCRPIGLCRLALFFRRPDYGHEIHQRAVEKDPEAALDWRFDLKRDLLYVSRLMRTYDDDPSANFYLSRLIWSLRDTPYFDTIRPMWLTYIPSTLLAKSMWSEGARTMKLQDFEREVLQKPGEPHPSQKDNQWLEGKWCPKFYPSGPNRLWRRKHRISFRHHNYRLTHIISNYGNRGPFPNLKHNDNPGPGYDEPLAGLPYIMKRYKDQTLNNGASAKIPKLIGAIPYDEEYHSPILGLADAPSTQAPPKWGPKPTKSTPTMIADGEAGLEWFVNG